MVLTRSSGVPMFDAAPSPRAVFSIASSGEVNGLSPGRCSARTLYSLCQRIRPAPASRSACSLLSAMCQESSPRQSERLTNHGFQISGARYLELPLVVDGEDAEARISYGKDRAALTVAGVGSASD